MDAHETPEVTSHDNGPASAPGSQNFGQSLRLMFRVLSFRATRAELLALNHRDLTVGLLSTWLVGMGRYWDNPRVELLQQMGVGSVIYVFVLALMLFIMIAAMFPRNWSYFRIVTFVTLTSLPAVLYAIPVQMMFPEPGLETANEINLAFLGIVSLWRVSLLLWFCKRLGQLPLSYSIIASIVPLLLLVFALTILNLERVVFNIMMGVDETQISPNDDVYMVLVMISFWTYILILPALLLYIYAMVVRYKSRQKEQALNTAPDHNLPPTETVTMDAPPADRDVP